MGNTSLDRAIPDPIGAYSRNDGWEGINRNSGLLGPGGDSMFYVAPLGAGVRVSVVTGFDTGLAGSTPNGTTRVASDITLSTPPSKPYAMSCTVDSGNNIYVAYMTSFTTTRVVKLSPGGGSTYTKSWEEQAFDFGSTGYLSRYLDIDVSDSPSGVSIAVAAFTILGLSATVLVSTVTRSVSGVWTPPKVNSVDSVNTSTGSADNAGFASGPLSICYTDTLFTYAGVTTMAYLYVLARPSQFGRTNLYSTSVNVTSSATHGNLLLVGSNVAPDSTSWFESYAFLSPTTGMPGGSVFGVMVSSASRSHVYFGEYVGGTGWTIPMKSHPRDVIGFWSDVIPNVRKYVGGEATPYVGDMKRMGFCAGPNRVAILCMSQDSGRVSVFPIHARIIRPAIGTGGAVEWRTGQNSQWKAVGDSAKDDPSWYVLQVHNGTGRFTSFADPSGPTGSTGRLVFTLLEWQRYSGAERAMLSYHVARRPERYNAKYESGKLSPDYTSTTVPTSEPLVTTEALGTAGPDPYLDRAVEVQFATNSTFTTGVSQTSPGISSARTSAPFSFDTWTADDPPKPRLPQGTIYARYRSVDVHGLRSPWAPIDPANYSQFVVAHPMSAAVKGPKSGGVISSSVAAPEFSWSTVDGWAADKQSAYQIIIESSAGVVQYDSGKVTSTAKSTTVSGLPSSSDVKKWKVQVWDTDNQTAGYSAYSTFVYAAPPAFTSVTVSATLPTPTFTWSYDPASGSGGPVNYSIWVADATTGDLVYISDTITSTSLTGTHTTPLPILYNNKNYSAIMFVTDAIGGKGQSPIVNFTTAWTPPATISGVVLDTSSFTTKGVVSVSWSTANQDASFLRYSVWRQPAVGDPVLVGTTANGKPTATLAMMDLMAPVGEALSYYVTQDSNYYGRVISSMPGFTGGGTPVLDGDYYWLLAPELQGADPSVYSAGVNALQLWHVTADSFSEEYEEETLNLIGRGRKKEVGTRYGFTGELALSLRAVNGENAREQRLQLQDIYASGDPMYLKTPFADVFFVALGAPAYEREAGRGSVESTKVTMPYEEVA